MKVYGVRRLVSCHCTVPVLRNPVGVASLYEYRYVTGGHVRGQQQQQQQQQEQEQGQAIDGVPVAVTVSTAQ